MKEFSAGESSSFIDWLSGWYSDLGTLRLEELVSAPERVAVASVDLVVGFCYEGTLASPRVASIVPKVVELLERAYEKGVRNYLVFQDSHPVEAEEFHSYAPHCVEGSREAEMIPELKSLPFSSIYKIFRKNSLSSSIGTDLDNWLDQHENVDTFIVVGDCTDLCVYQLAMHLRLCANAANIEREVYVPANCVETYDLSVDAAEKAGVLPHDGDLLHALFLYHMALNGVKVVAGIE